MATCNSWIASLSPGDLSRSNSNLKFRGSHTRIACPTTRSRVSFSRKVSAMAGMTTPLKLEKVILTKHEIDEARRAMDSFVQSVGRHPEMREDSSPYYLLHGEGDAVYGTVLMFHGFSASTSQMSFLSQYLYENGFNVYQPGLCGHCFLNPNKNWPKHVLKHDIKEGLAKKLLSDPELGAYIRDFTSISSLTPNQVCYQIGDYVILLLATKLSTCKGAVARLKSLSELDLFEAVCDEEFSDSKFYKYFESDHLKYLYEAEQRMQEVEALPGPLFTVGLSMGGAAALSLAARHSDKVAKTAVYAPLLKIVNQVNCRFSKLGGPLGAEEKGWYPDRPFLLSCMVAVDVFGHFVRQEPHLDSLAKLPTLIVQTEIDDSADYAMGMQVIKEIEDRSGEDGPPHFSTLYAAAEAVPHPMVDPFASSLGHTNKFWQSLYQETFRFLTEGIVDIEHLHEKTQDPSLPQVGPLEIPALVVA